MTQVFVSYAHEDAKAAEELRTWLADTIRHFGRTLWSDDSIQPGQRWSPTILRAIADSDVFVQLVSSANLASTYLTETEAPAIEQAERGRGALVLTIILEKCSWKRRFHADVSDVSALSGLTSLQSLILRATQVSEVSSLSGLTALERLDLGGTQVTDWSPLADLPELNSLGCMGLDLRQVGALPNKVRELVLFNAQWADGRPLPDAPHRIDPDGTFQRRDGASSMFRFWAHEANEFRESQGLPPT